MIMLIIYNEFILYLFLILLVDPLTLIIVLSLFNSHINITSNSPQLFVIYMCVCVCIIYIVDLPVVRPRSCRVIYYFDTPALGIRHQLFDRVTRQHIQGNQLYGRRTSLSRFSLKTGATESSFFLSNVRIV